MEHAARVQQFVVELQAEALAGQRGEIEHATGVVEEQGRRRITDELGDFPGHAAVGYLNAGD
ncbi:hypothetical protein D3C81_1973440 [compost metagenome]